MQVTLDREQHRRAAERAAELGVSLAEYIRGLVDRDLAGESTPAPDVSRLFGIGDSGGSDVAADGDDYLAEALAAEHRSG